MECAESSHKEKKMKRSSSSNWISPCFEQAFSTENDVLSAPKKSEPSTKERNKRSKRFTNTKRHRNEHDTETTWAEKFAPTAKEELAVHKKKVLEIEEWLKHNLRLIPCTTQQRPGILLLTGPAGVGKTATVKALANDLCFEIQEWSSVPCESMPRTAYIEGSRQPYDVMNDIIHQSQTSIFNNFLLRVNKYPSLFSTTTSRVILIEEFPNVYLKDSASFHSLLRKFHKTAKSPAVFIISDCTSGESLENHLFPKTLQMDLNITNINFNPVAPTMLIKALNRICTNVKGMGIAENLPAKSIIEYIASGSMGDVRSAVNSLQFSSIQRKPVSSQNDAIVLPKLKKNKYESKTKSNICDNQRDSSLFLFHALGKILYSKRAPSEQSSCDQLPSHLQHFRRDPLISNPEEVFEKTSVSADNFALFLHENYLSFVDDIEVAAESSAYLSQADVISIEWTGRDVLKNYTASVAARGLMFNLKPISSSHRWRPLHKPQYFSKLRDSRNLNVSVRNAFKDSRLTLRELELEFIPYALKIGLPSLSIEKSALLKQIGHLGVKRFSGFQIESLNEKELVQDDFQSQIEKSISQISEVSETASVMNESDDEEIIIEEYDF